MPVSSVQYGQTPWHYANGLHIAYSSTTALTISSGSILDSTGNYQLTVPSTLTVTATSTGLNGIDTGALAASTVYAVYVVADPITQQAIGAMVSANLTTPLLPFGYNAYALVGYITTDASSHFLLGYWTAGNSTRRLFMYDAPQATAVTAGNATSYTAVSLETLVPLVDLTPVWIYTAYTPAAAGDALFMQPQAGTGDAIKITGQAAAVIVTSNSYLFSSKNSTHQQINYKLSVGTGAVAIDVAGYEFNI